MVSSTTPMRLDDPGAAVDGLHVATAVGGYVVIQIRRAVNVADIEQIPQLIVYIIQLFIAALFIRQPAIHVIIVADRSVAQYYKSISLT